MQLAAGFAVVATILTGCAKKQADKFDGKIVGIDSGAGIMKATESAIEAYDLDFKLVPSSGPAMTAALKKAVDNNEWIVVTGWKPHWKFARWELKFLDDPKGVYGKVENIHTVTRVGFEKDFPALAAFFKAFKFNDQQLGSLMGEVSDYDGEPVDAARKWMTESRDLVDGWLAAANAVSAGDNKDLEMVYVNWAEGIAMTNLAKAILEDELGYTVSLTMADVAPVFTSLASGDKDVFLDAWLPVTHESYMEEYGDNVVDLGVNYEGARIGLVVPAYVTVDSIAEMNQALAE